MDGVSNSIYYRLIQAKSPHEVLKIISSHLTLLGFYCHNITLIDCDKKSSVASIIQFDQEHQEVLASMAKTNSIVTLSPYTEKTVTKNMVIQISDADENLHERTAQMLSYFSIRASAYLPISSPGFDVLGYIILFDTEKHPASFKHLEPVMQFLEEVYFILKNYRDLAEFRLKEKEMEVLLGKSTKIFKLAQEVIKINSLEKVYHSLLEKTLSAYGFDMGTILLPIEEGAFVKERMCSQTYQDLSQKIDKVFSEIGKIPLSEPMLDVQIFNTKKVYYHPDVRGMDRSVFSDTVKKVLEVTGIPVSMLLVPIIQGDKVIAVLSLRSFKEVVELSESELKIFETLGYFVGAAFYNAELFTLTENQKNMLAEKDRIIQEDLNLAKRIQLNVISKEHEKIDELDFFVYYEPQTDIGGDFYDITEVKKNHIRIFLADATGHGIQAALITMLINSEYQVLRKSEKRPDELLQELNQSFMEKYYHLTVFFTGLILDIDLDNKKIIYSSAGHPDQYLLSGQDLHCIHSGGKMIGLFEKASYELIEHRVGMGDKLLFFTDGLFEEFYQEDELGEEGILKAVEKNISRPLKELCENIIHDLDVFLQGGEYQDDVTLIGLEIKSDNK